MATTTVWPKKARPAWKTRMDFDALVEARRKGDGKWPARFANMTKAERGEALENILGAYAANKEYGPVFDETWAAGRGNWGPYAKSAKRRTKAKSPNYENFKYGERMGDLQTVARTVLGPHYGTDAYPEFRSWIDVLEGRGEARADLPLSKHESIAQDLPEPLQTPYRVAMRGTRGFLTTGASALRALGRSVGLIPEPMPSGAAGGEDFLGRFVERQGTEAALDEVADRRRYAGTKARGELREGLEHLGPQALSLTMGSAIYGGALPLVFGADAAQARYDYGRARGETGAAALGKGLAYGAADTALWMVPTPKWLNSRVGPAVGNNLSLFGKGVGSHLLGRAAFGNGDDEETRQDWEGGEAAEQLARMSEPPSMRVDWMPTGLVRELVRKDPMLRKIELEGQLLPEGEGDPDFPYKFLPAAREFSPAGVPYSALDAVPAETLNANVTSDETTGRAMTYAMVDPFALSEREQQIFDEMTKTGKVSPNDERTRRLRAMLAAGQRDMGFIKSLAWAERRNRDIELAKTVAKENGDDPSRWQDYYVGTSSRMIGGPGLREGVASDLNARAEWLRDQYETLAGLGRTREAENALDTLRAFRKRALYLAARYNLHPEYARVTYNPGLFGDRDQANVVHAGVPRDLYLETGRYGLEISPYAKERAGGLETARTIFGAGRTPGSDVEERIRVARWARDPETGEPGPVERVLLAKAKGPQAPAKRRTAGAFNRFLEERVAPLFGLDNASYDRRSGELGPDLVESINRHRKRYLDDTEAMSFWNAAGDLSDRAGRYVLPVEVDEAGNELSAHPEWLRKLFTRTRRVTRRKKKR